MERLFVYGSLAPGRPNEHILGELEGVWEPAVIRGTLHDRGWGAGMGFPAVVPESNGDEVEGLLFTSAALLDFWQVLDDFEGEGYQRVQVSAWLSCGSVVEAHVYALRVSTVELGSDHGERAL